MSVYYIKTVVEGADVTYVLDATKEIEVVKTGKASSSPLESGLSVADTYINNNDVITLSGVISDVKNSSKTEGNLSVADYVNGLTTLKESGTPFEVYWAGGLDRIDNCVFTSLNIRQGGSKGSLTNPDKTFTNSFNISMNFMQVLFGTKAQEATIRAEEVANDTSAVIADQNEQKKPTNSQQQAIDNLFNRDTKGLF